MNKPILIFGLPRSGTTWIGKVFDSHPETLYKHEPDSEDWMQLPLYTTTDQADTYRDYIHNYMQNVLAIKSFDVHSKLPLFRKSYINTLSYYYYYLKTYASKSLRPYTPKAVAELLKIRQNYPKARLVWKSIESMGRLTAIMKINNAFGLQVIRHPCGHIASVLQGESKNKFTSDSRTSEDYSILQLLLATPSAQRHQLSIEKLKLLDPIERLAWRWVLSNDFVIEQAEQMPDFKVVYYDHLCQYPMESYAEVFDFCALDWNKQTESFISSSTSTSHSGYYSVYKNAAESANKWQKQLTSEMVEKIMAIVEKSTVNKLLSTNYANSYVDLNHYSSQNKKAELSA